MDIKSANLRFLLSTIGAVILGAASGTLSVGGDNQAVVTGASATQQCQPQGRMQECDDLRQPHSPAAWATNEQGQNVAAADVGRGKIWKKGGHENWLPTDYERGDMIPGFVRMADYEVTEQPKWLWSDRIALGSITMCGGAPGTNKSSLMNHLAACVTRGRRIFGGEGKPVRGGVVLLQGEDSLDRVRESLDANGADLKRVVALDRKQESSDVPLLLPEQIGLISSITAEIKAKLVVIDPTDDFFSGSLSNDNFARKAVKPLADMAQEQNLAVVLVRHLTKTGTGPAMLRGRGSIGLSAIARSDLMVGIDPLCPTQRIVAQSKSNLGPIAKSLKFRPITDEQGRLRIEAKGESDITANDLVQSESSEMGPAVTTAAEALLRVLAEGPVPVKEARKAVMNAGVSDKTVWRAKKLLGIVTVSEGSGPGTVHSWQLPDDSELINRTLKKLGLSKPKKAA